MCRSEVLRGILMDIANELRERGVLDEEECFIDATFVMAKGGGAEVGPTKRGKGMKIMAIVDRHGLPLSVSTHAPTSRSAPRTIVLRLLHPTRKTRNAAISARSAASQNAALRIAFRQDTNLGYVSCLANVPIGVCNRCGCKNWNEDAEAITEDAVRRE